MALTSFNTKITELSLMQSSWMTELNPLLRNPVSKGILINVPLQSGNNVVYTQLGRKAQGWMVADIDAPVTLYRSQPIGEKTITINSSGAANAQLYVF